MIDDIKSAVESANAIALAGLNAGREIAERESAAKIRTLREALQRYVDAADACAAPHADHIATMLEYGEAYAQVRRALAAVKA